MMNQPVPMNVQVPLSALTSITCDTCGKEVFVSAVKIKRVPSLYSPTGQEMFMQVPFGHCCAFCGAIYDLNMNYIGVCEEVVEEDKLIVEKEVLTAYENPTKSKEIG